MSTELLYTRKQIEQVLSLMFLHLRDDSSILDDEIKRSNVLSSSLESICSSLISKLPSANFVFQFGKHSGRSISQVYSSGDESWLGWALGDESVDLKVKEEVENFNRALPTIGRKMIKPRQSKKRPFLKLEELSNLYEKVPMFNEHPSVGKYKDKTFIWILENQPSYFKWMLRDTDSAAKLEQMCKDAQEKCSIDLEQFLTKKKSNVGSN